MAKEHPPENCEESAIILPQFETLSLSEVSETEVQENLQEIACEVEVLESILMKDPRVHDEFYPTFTVQTSTERLDLCVQTLLIPIYPEESMPVQLTKISSKEHSEAKTEEQNVKIKIAKLQNMPCFTLKLFVPATYPSRTPPIFTLENAEMYPKYEELLYKVFSEIYEQGSCCIYEFYHYLQCEFISEYSQANKLSVFKQTVTSDSEFAQLQARSRDTYAYQLAKSLNTCMICFDEYYGTDIFALTECTHFYCKTCLKAYCDSLIVDGKVNHLKCPDMKCNRMISDLDLHDVVTTEMFEKLEKFRIANKVNNSEDQTWCPVQECGGVARIVDKNRFGECTECDFRFCLHCKSWYHSGRRCPVLSLGKSTWSNMSKKAQEEFIQEQLADYYVKKYSKKCPHCQAAVTKTSGCNKMTCTSCLKFFCWTCLAPIKNYDHFSTSPECWNTMGQTDIVGLGEQDVEHVKEKIGDQDMENAVTCPHCGSLTKKKTDCNYLSCEKCDGKVCFYCGGAAEVDHYDVYSCFKFTKRADIVNVNETIKNII